MKYSHILAVGLVLVTSATSGLAQTKFSSIKLTDGTNSATLNPPTTGTGTFTFPSITGAQTVLSDATGQTIKGALTLGVGGTTAGVLNMMSGTSNVGATLRADSLTANRSYQFPNASGTIALVGDIAAVNGTADRITVTGTSPRVVDIASTYVGQSSITTLGTVTTGTWHGTAIDPLYGGTGLNTSAAANGQLLIGNGSGLSLGAITGTANQVTVTNGAGTIGLSLADDVTIAGTMTAATLASTGAVTAGSSISAVTSITGASLISTGKITAADTIKGGTLASTGNISAVGSITGANLTAGSLTATGAAKFAGTGVATASTTSTVVTNASVTATSAIVAVMNSGDIIITRVVPAAGSFTINYSAPADGGEKFSYVIIN